MEIDGEVKLRFLGSSESGDTTQSTLYLDLLIVYREDDWFQAIVTWTSETGVPDEMGPSDSLVLAMKGYTDDGESWTFAVWNLTSANWQTAYSVTVESNAWENFTLDPGNHVNASGSVTVLLDNEGATDASASAFLLDALFVEWEEVTVYENQEPYFTSTPITTGVNGTLYEYQAVAVDPDPPDTIWYDLDPSTNATFLDIDHDTGLVQGMPDSSGWFVVSLMAYDGNETGGNLTAWQNYTLTISEPAANQAPWITSGPTIWAVYGEDYSYLAEATDNDSDPLSWSVESTAPWLDIDQAGYLNGTPLETGYFYVNITVSDGELSDTQSYVLRVYLSPTSASPDARFYVGVAVAVGFGTALIVFGVLFKQPLWTFFAGLWWIFSALAVFVELSPGWTILIIGLGFVLLLDGGVRLAENQGS